MLKLISILCLTASIAWCGHGPERRVSGPLVTVLLEFDQPHSDTSLQVMEKEATSLLTATGVQVKWLLKSELPHDAQFGDLVSFRVRGHCEMDSDPINVDDHGPLAMAYTANGVVLHFGEVECDRVKTAVLRTLNADDLTVRTANDILGRALGRVVAHEMYHILGNEMGHTKDGVTRKSLTANDLTCPRARFSERAADEVWRQYKAD